MGRMNGTEVKPPICPGAQRGQRAPTEIHFSSASWVAASGGKKTTFSYLLEVAKMAEDPTICASTHI